MPDKVAEFIRNEVETGSRIDKIKFGLLNLQKNNVDRVENTAFSSLKKKITNEYLKLGKPVISLKNKLESYLNDTFGKYVIHVSLTDTKLYSIASVIIEQS